MNNRKAVARQEWVLDPPMDFATPYALGGYDERRIRQVMFKYLDRENNLARAWTRICHHLPEIIDASGPLTCLEFGTAHGAMLELLRALGHEAVGTDFAWRGGKPARPHRPWHRLLIESVSKDVSDAEQKDVVVGWPYQPIIESLGLDVRMIDGRERPYPFEDKSFDVVCCYQAVDAFGEPETWPETVAEFCRIARKAVVVGYNHIAVNQMDRKDRVAAAQDAWLTLSKFEAHGMKTVFTELDTTRRGLHPVAMKFLPLG